MRLDAIVADSSIAKMARSHYMEIEPVILEEFVICNASPADIPAMIQSASDVFNREYNLKGKGQITEDHIQRATSLYQNIFHSSQYLICKAPTGEIIGSLCTTMNADNISIEIINKYFSEKKELRSPATNYFYGSITFVDKEKLKELDIKESVAVTIWEEMLKLASKMIVSFGEGIYFGHIDASAFAVIKKILGMPWQQIGEEIDWLNSRLLPCMITTKQLTTWLNSR